MGVGPGRRVNQTQGVDAIDVLSALCVGVNAVGMQGFHTARFKGDDPRLMVLLRLQYTDGTSQSVASGSEWKATGADHVFNPDSSQGAWAGGACVGATCSGQPQENLDLRNYPFGWASPGFLASASSGWGDAVIAKPFFLPLSNRPARPVAVYERGAVSVKPWAGTGTGTGFAGASAVSGCKNCFVIDYGRELQGGVNLTFDCTAPSCQSGHKVAVLLSEWLNGTGGPQVPMLTGNNYTAVWTLRSGRQAGVMQHEYDEFRYALVVNAPGPLTTETAKAWVLRGMTSDDPDDQYGDAPTLLASTTHNV